MTETLSTTWAIIQLLLGFTFIIAVHELGHFLVAKKVGIRCTQFAIGFGHALLAYRKGIGFRVGTTEPELRRLVLERATADGVDVGQHTDKPIPESKIHQLAEEYGFGETEYRLNWMPLGGYVKMVGQDDMDPAAASSDPRSFTQKSVGARMAVISAGVIMNAIFAVIFFILAFSSGVEFPPAIVGWVPGDSPAAVAPSVEDPTLVGLLPGDRVVAVDDEPTSDFTSVLIAAPLGSPNVPIKFTIDRPQPDGSMHRLNFMIKPSPADQRNPLPYVGIGMPSTVAISDDKNLDDADRAELADQQLRPGMHMNFARVDDDNEHAVTEYWQFDRVLQASAGKPVTVAFVDEQGTTTLTRTPKTTYEQTKVAIPNSKDKEITDHLLGLVPAVRVNGVLKGSAADGILEDKDLIARIGDTEWPTVGEIMDTVQRNRGKQLALEVVRDGQTKQLTATPRGKWFGLGEARLGIGLTYVTDGNRFIRKLPDSPLAALDLAPGSVIQKIAGRDVSNFTDLRLALEHAGEGPVEFVMRRPVAGGVEQTQTVELSPQAVTHLRSIEWSVELPPLKPLVVLQKAEHIGQAVGIGFEKTHLFMVQTYITLARLVQGWLHVENLRGPVGIVAEGRRVTQKGWAYLMFFLGLISINLAVINFLPMPIVDGGLAVLLIVEKLRGKPLSPNIAGAINLVGLVLIGTLFITLTIYDVARLLF